MAGRGQGNIAQVWQGWPSVGPLRAGGHACRQRSTWRLEWALSVDRCRPVPRPHHPFPPTGACARPPPSPLPQDHLKADNYPVKGVPSRFCQRCGQVSTAGPGGPECSAGVRTRSARTGARRAASCTPSWWLPQHCGRSSPAGAGLHLVEGGLPAACPAEPACLPGVAAPAGPPSDRVRGQQAVLPQGAGAAQPAQVGCLRGRRRGLEQQ